MKVLKKKAHKNANMLKYVEGERKIVGSMEHPFLTSLHYAF